MLAVTVERHLLDGCLTFGTPVISEFLAIVLHGQITSLEGRWKATRCVDMLAEKAGWS